MPRTKSTVREDYAGIEQAWLSGGELAATRMAVQKYAQVIDVTESGRDMKPLISGMFEAMDRLKQLEEIASRDTRETPLDNVLRMARSA